MGVVPHRLSGVFVALGLASVLAACSSTTTTATTTTTSITTATAPSNTTTSTLTTTTTRTLPPIPFSALPSPTGSRCPAGYDFVGVLGAASAMCVPYAYLPGGTSADPNDDTSCPPGSHVTMGPALCVSDQGANNPSRKIVAPIPPTCRTQQLRVLLQEGEVSGSGAYLVILSNVSSSSCSMDGYPKVVLRDASGKAISSYLPHVNVMAIPGPAQPSVVVLAARVGRAQFRFGGPDWIPMANNNTGGPCPSATEAVITPPGNSQVLVVRQHFALCSGGVEAVRRAASEP